ncbi:MAG: MFS transporter [Acidobacteria bacterium]|nr:MFS transporter [Acidobacteriota bacterium]
MAEGQGGQGGAPPPPPPFFRWLVLVVISLAMFGNYYVYDCIGPMAKLLSAQLGYSDSQIGLLQAIYSFPNLFMVLVGGIIIDRIGVKRSVFLFAALCLAGALVTALSPKLGVMATGRLIFGLGAESLIVGVTTGIAKWFRGKELSFAFGLNLTISRLGSLAAQVSPTWAKDAFDSWQGPLRIALVFALVCVVAAGLYWALENRAAARYALGNQGGTDKIVWGDLLRFPASFWYVVALCLTFYSGIFPFQTFAQKFFVDAHGASADRASLLVGMLTVFAMVATPLFGLLADRIGKRALLMILGSFLLLPVYWIMGYTRMDLVVPMAMMGVAFSLIPAVMWPSVAYMVAEEKLGTAYGLMTLIQNVGLFGFNLLVGWANDLGRAGAAHPEGYRLGMWIFSSLGFSALLFAVLLRRSERGPGGHGLEEVTPDAPATNR